MSAVRYVIIGNSAGGIGAVEGIRQVDTSGEITIISDEALHTYSRPLISYLLGNATTEEKMLYRGRDFYERNNCNLVHGTVTKIDKNARAVILASGERLVYDKLLVATGSRAFVPDFEGLGTVKNQFTFMTKQNALELSQALENGGNRRVLIVGAGLIGLKCAEGIMKKTPAAKITVVDLAPRVLPSILDENGAKLVQKHIEAKGIKFILSQGVKRFDNNTAVLENGEKIDFDVLVLAVGVRPNTSLLEGIATINKGIVVNEKSETTASDIYAAGDCTETRDISSGESKIMALLPNAYIQGECAGINMANGEKTFTNAIPMNAIGFFGLHIITAGSYNGEIYSENAENRYKQLFYSDNRLNGFILIGDIQKAGIYTSLIRERTPLDSIDFPLVCEKAGLLAFTKQERQSKLGGTQ